MFLHLSYTFLVSWDPATICLMSLVPGVMAWHTARVSESASFKQCSLCQHQWCSRAEFLDDPEVTLVGYQSMDEDLSQGMLLFNHGCGTTMAVDVARFAELYHGPAYAQPLMGTAVCEGHCESQYDLQRCDNPCAYAWVREVIQIVRHWPKPEAGSVEI